MSQFFGHPPDDTEMDKMVAAEVVETDAKHPEISYSANTKLLEAEQVLNANRIEIDKTLAWMNPLVEDLGLMDKLSSRRLNLESPA